MGLRKIRILEVTGLAHGGSGAHVLQLAQRLDPSRFEVDVAMAKGSPLEPEFRQLGLKVYATRMDHEGHPLKAFLGLVDLCRLIRSGHYDIIHTHTSVAGVLGRVAAKIHGHACVVHMLHAFASHDNVPPVRRQLFRWVEKLSDSWTHRYLAGSDFMIERGVSTGIFTRGKATRIYYGIDLPRLRLGRKSQDEARRALGIAADVPVIGFVGRLEEQKGVDLLLIAMAKAVQSKPTAVLLLLGDGKLRSGLEALAVKLGIAGQARFLGWQKNVAQVVSCFDVMAIPSRWESFGMVAAEGMALAKPVVASRVGGLPEVIKDGETGALVEPETPSEMASQLLRLLDHPEQAGRMGRAGEDRVDRNFSAEQMVSAHERFFEALYSSEQHPSMV